MFELTNRHQYEELGLFVSGKGLPESPCECGIEPPGSINHRVSYYLQKCHLAIQVQDFNALLRCLELPTVSLKDFQ